MIDFLLGFNPSDLSVIKVQLVSKQAKSVAVANSTVKFVFIFFLFGVSV